jgi:hypothetical protein
MTSSSIDRARGANSALAIKAPCRVATTANITLSGLQTIDGVTVAADDRVLVKNQTTASENGIYIADTSTWDRAPDFDGNRDIAKGTMVRVNEGTNNAGGWFSVSSSDDITVGTDSITFTRENLNYFTTVSATATAGQTLFNLGVTYQSGTLSVFVNGLRMRSSDYTETSSTSITFGVGLAANDEVDVLIGTAVTNLTAAAANATSITDGGDYFASTNVEAALQEIGLWGSITADNGDADKTLTYNSSTGVQRWNTALTANRTATLSTTGAKEGAKFLCIRGSGATGNFTLAIGSLATLRAPGEWALVGYDAGTSAYVLLAYGILPSAENLGMTDNGDADATLLTASSLRTQRWNTTLTADRTATLSTTGAYTGARFRIVRTESATGAFSLIVAGAATLLRLAPGQWCEAEYNGTAWVIVGYGDIRQGINSLVTLDDDFVGQEIDGYKWTSRVGTDSECVHPEVLADQAGGVVRMTTGDDAAASMAVNGVQLQSQLNWKADKGGLTAEFRVAIDTITSVCVFLGLTDQRSALEMPFTLAAGDTLTSNASDAVGVLFDTAADTDNWWMVGVAADVDATKQNSALAPTAGTFETWRIDVSATGVATFYRNGTLVGTAMTGAVTQSAALTPVVAAFSRTSASRNIDVDKARVQAQR